MRNPFPTTVGLQLCVQISRDARAGMAPDVGASGRFADCGYISTATVRLVPSSGMNDAPIGGAA